MLENNELPESSSDVDWDLPPRFDRSPEHAANVVPEVHVEQESDVAQALPQEVHVEREAAADVIPEVQVEQEADVLQGLPQEVHVEREAVVVQGLPLVTEALRREDLASFKFIFGIDFNITNDWKGKYSFDGKSLHDTGYTHNPYEKVISIIGKTLEPLSTDNMIQCYGFGDERTRDKGVFGFYHDRLPCYSFQEVLCRYRKILPNLRPAAGPISYAPVVDAAVDIVNKSCGEYHILFIITDGQGIGSDNTSDEELSPQQQSIKSILDASSYPLSIVLIGVGDGPWEDIQKFEKKILARKCDSFQFVNFTEIMSEKALPSENETAFAAAALMKIPNQRKAAIIRGLPRQNVTGIAKQVIVLSPPMLVVEQSNSSSSWIDTESPRVCTICFNGEKVIAFFCGHQTCTTCGSKVEKCPFCREPISNRIRLL